MTRLPAILIRCDASPEIGLGHVVRCVALADQLRLNHDVCVGFAMREGSLGAEIVRQASYSLLQVPAILDYEAWLSDALRQLGAQVLVADVRDDLSRSTLASLARQGHLIAVLDDVSDRRLAADLAFYPPVPQVSRADWTEFRGERFVGWEWTILRSQFTQPTEQTPRSGNSLLITMGGTDPAGLTLQAVRAIGRVPGDFSPVVILGSGFQHRRSLQDLLGKAKRRFTVRENVSDMRAEMAQANLAVCSFGGTAYELAATGVPAIYLCLTPDHAESASALDRAGMGWSLGIFSDVTDERLGEAIGRLLRDRSAREKMSTQARALMDGHGARRTAEIVADRASKL